MGSASACEEKGFSQTRGQTQQQNSAFFSLRVAGGCERQLNGSRLWGWLYLGYLGGVLGYYRYNPIERLYVIEITDKSL